MDYKPLFTCAPMRIKDGETEATWVNMRVDVGPKTLCSFILKSGSVEDANRLAALLNETVDGILPSRQAW